MLLYYIFRIKIVDQTYGNVLKNVARVECGTGMNQLNYPSERQSETTSDLIRYVDKSRRLTFLFYHEDSHKPNH